MGSSSVERVESALREHGLACRVRELPNSTRTAREAAEAVGCTVGQIAKSLIFKSEQTRKPILVVMSGSNRVALERLQELVGEPATKPDANFVREQTGYAIGGVPPIGHATPLATFLDEDLFEYATVWAAAGSPNAVFEVSPGDLERLTGGRKVAVKAPI